MLHNLTLALAGGVLIGLSAGLFMLMSGRILGISGLAAGLVKRRSEQRLENLLLLAGLPLGALLFQIIDGPVALSLTDKPWLLIVGGLLVGYGTRLGSGCTSGHGVCGLARLSPRSLVATGLFMAAAAVTVFITRHL